MVLDTHVLLWWLSGSSDLPQRARKIIQAAQQQTGLVLSAISIFEIATAVRRRRIELARPLDVWLADLAALPELRIEPVHAAIAVHAALLDENVHGDPADRIILATALWLDQPLATADEKLRTSGLAILAW
jgi:PIN domain nuclease of toxin-antitoxin system